jgi:DNA recombination protein RmuC
MEILLSLIGLLVGAIATWFFCNRKTNMIIRQRETLSISLAARTKEVELIREQMEKEARESADHLDEQNREAEIRLKELRQQADQRLQEVKEQAERRMEEQRQLVESQMQQQIETLRERMTNVTQQLLKQRTDELEANNSKAMESVVNPLKEKLGELHELVQATRDKAQENSATVREQIRNMMERAQQIGNEAARLTNALTHNSQFQGSMGEQVLGVILDNAGLRKGRDYEEQTTMKSETGETMINEETGQRMRPDVILHFPDQKDAIIDAKVSLTAYERYVNATDAAEQQLMLKQHVESMRRHVDELSAKNYSKYLPRQHATIDFVIMFVPFEGAFQAAMQHDPTLWTDALRKNVCIAGELNLTVILRMIKLAWKQFDQTQNQEEVYKNAEVLIKRVGLLCKRYAELGKSIEQTERKYKECDDLFYGRQNLLAPARRIVELGAKDDDRIPSLGDGE